MGVVTLSAKTSCLETDQRWRKWGKLVRTPADIDLSKRSGYALCGPFVKWGEAVALESGQYILAASEVGSAKYRQYNYALIGWDEAGEGTGVAVIPWADIDAALADAPVSDAQRAAAKNSTVYAAALFCKLAMDARARIQADEAPAAVDENPAPMLRGLVDSLLRELGVSETTPLNLDTLALMANALDAAYDYLATASEAPDKEPNDAPRAVMARLADIAYTATQIQADAREDAVRVALEA